MTFLRRFWTTCDAFVRRAVGRPIDESAFTRFIYHSRYLKDPYNAFMPPPNGQLSVCQILGRSTERLWRLGSAVRRDRRLRGRADFGSSAPELASPDLRLVIDHVGYRGHALVEGWPADKPRRMLVAKRLAQHAQVRPSSDDA
jgi:hypothetical protein